VKQVTIYEYAKCGTCRSAVKWLKNEGYELSSIPLFEQPPSEQELNKLIERSGLDIRKWFNTSGEVYKELKLKDKLPAMSREEQLRLLASNGRLIKRPIVSDGSRITVGFKEEAYGEVWGKK
jgi:arsenate reductase